MFVYHVYAILNFVYASFTVVMDTQLKIYSFLSLFSAYNCFEYLSLNSEKKHVRMQYILCNIFFFFIKLVTTAQRNNNFRLKGNPFLWERTKNRFPPRRGEAVEYPRRSRKPVCSSPRSELREVRLSVLPTAQRRLIC